jgi:hypothetical protein
VNVEIVGTIPPDCAATAPRKVRTARTSSRIGNSFSLKKHHTKNGEQYHIFLVAMNLKVLFGFIFPIIFLLALGGLPVPGIMIASTTPTITQGSVTNSLTTVTTITAQMPTTTTTTTTRYLTTTTQSTTIFTTTPFTWIPSLPNLNFNFLINPVFGGALYQTTIGRIKLAITWTLPVIFSIIFSLYGFIWVPLHGLYHALGHSEQKKKRR